MKEVGECICKVCQKVFCCSKCRERHEVKNHAIGVKRTGTDPQVIVHLFCPICEGKPLPLRAEIYDELLEHIKLHHLPLQCRKCTKTYEKIEELTQFSTCAIGIDGSAECCPIDNSCDTDTSKATVTKEVAHTTIATQTSPMSSSSDSHVTPISLVNIRWKARNKITHEEFISDSVSSIRNISAISNSSLRRSSSSGTASTVKGKVVRSTSTPVQGEWCMKPKEQTFNASGVQVSSIYNSGCDSDVSPAIHNTNGTPAKQALDVNRYRKAAVRPKISAVTPLRQVMSKSIQKAFAEHGPPVHTGASAVLNSPLDLRMSPVVRRMETEKESINSEVEWIGGTSSYRKELLLSSQNLTTESIVITRTRQLSSNVASISGNSTSSDQSNTHNQLLMENNTNSSNSVYTTCRSVEIITSTTEVIEESMGTVKESNVKEKVVDELQSISSITPITRIPGAAINKKIIHFDTPIIEVDLVDSRIEKSSNDVFFTPNSTPVRKSPPFIGSMLPSKVVPRNLNGQYGILRRPALRECAKSESFTHIENVKENQSDDDEVFYSKTVSPKDCQQPLRERTWSLSSFMNSVMRLPSFRNAHSKDKLNEVNANSGTASLIKRCASIAGSFIRQRPSIEEEPFIAIKRKRTQTMDSHSNTQLSDFSFTTPTKEGDYSIMSKRFRIQGRKPIERMRQSNEK